MIKLSTDVWIRTAVILSLLMFVVVGIHVADDIVNQDLPPDVQTGALVMTIVFTLQAFATLSTWAGRRIGFALLGIIALLWFYATFLSHFLQAGVRGYVGLSGGAPDVWTPVYVLASLFGGVVTLTTVLITIYLLIAGVERTS